jgi:hypothetical protein
MHAYQTRKKRNESQRLRMKKKARHKQKCVDYMKKRTDEKNAILFETLLGQVKKNISYNEIFCNMVLQKDRLMKDIRSQNLIINQCKIDQSDPFEYYHLSKFDIEDKKDKTWYQWIMGF